MELYGNKNAPNSDCCLRRNVRGATQFPLHGGELSVAYHHTRRQDNGCGSRQRLRPCSFRRRPRKSIRRLLLCRGPTVRSSLCQPVLAVTTLPQRFDGPMINPVQRIVNRENCFGNVFCHAGAAGIPPAGRSGPSVQGAPRQRFPSAAIPSVSARWFPRFETCG